VDRNGVVTGIVDWDGAIVGPRCIGPTALPMFLCRDWYPGESGDNLERPPHMAFNHEYYRNLYAAAVVKAAEDQGIKDTVIRYTAKSALYQAAVAALYEGGHPGDFTNKVLRRIPIGAHPYAFKKLLGKGWPAGEAYLKCEIPKIFKAEAKLPDPKSMKEIAAATQPVPSLKPSSIDAGMDNLHLTTKRTKTVDIPPKMTENLLRLLIENDIVKIQTGIPFSTPKDGNPVLPPPPQFYWNERQNFRIIQTIEMDESGDAVTPLGFDVVRI
jgi:hypothetical protein